MTSLTQGTVKAGPSKRFFVSMMTRDIDLKDAILDLLDNCVDGIQRKLKGVEANEKPYNEFWAKITATPSGFKIEDNCAGIPRKVAEERAFMLGRPLGEIDEDLHTVGMYGIGMKRAIFKMGKSCIVYSNPYEEEQAFEVKISPEWMENESWELPISYGVERSSNFGTTLSVSDLYESIARNFDTDDSGFLEDLAAAISQFYAVIMGKGFAVFLNGKLISPVDLTLLSPIGLTGSIAPYVFSANIDEVETELVVGFRRQLASESELEREADQPRSSEDAGWTVICNDRVVLYNDKGPLTGWGRGNVPKYHTQFISISGVTIFRSAKLLHLPLTTTKRGLDTDNKAYMTALDYMMEGLKKFTDYTNRWKGRENETTPAFSQTISVPATQAAASILQSDRMSSVRKLGSNVNARRFIPDLPYPEDKNPKRRIVYTRAVAEIELLSNHFFPGTPNTNIAPSDIGIRSFEKCLDIALLEIKK